MSQIMTARATYVAGMRFDAESGSGHHTPLDAAVDDGGQDTGFRPMELLLVGLAGCTGMDVISILRKKRQQVTGYEIRVEGKRADTHPMLFLEIHVEHIVTGHHIQPDAVARAIHLSEERYCGAGATMGKAAHITNTFRILEATTPATLVETDNQALPAVQVHS